MMRWANGPPMLWDASCSDVCIRALDAAWFERETACWIIGMRECTPPVDRASVSWLSRRLRAGAPLYTTLHEVNALVPTAELSRYAIDLRSMTGGRGRFAATHDHYDVLPDHLVDKAKASMAAAKG